MRVTKAQLIEHINAGRVTLCPNAEYYLTITDGEFKGTHHIKDSQIDNLGGIVGVEGDHRSTGPRQLFIR